MKTLKHSIFATIFIYLVLALFYIVPSSIPVIKPIEEALTDFELTDIIFSQLRDANTEADTNIVLLNTYDPVAPDRMVLAQQINTIKKGRPKVIIVDVDLSTDTDPYPDSVLESVMKGTRNLILAGHAEIVEGTKEAKVIEPLNRFAKHGSIGIGNVLSERDRIIHTAREFTPRITSGSKTYNHVGLQAVSFFNLTSAANFSYRATNHEIINYTRTAEHYLSLDIEQSLDTAVPVEIYRNKIVIIGFMGNQDIRNREEYMYYTPMNEKYAGKARPDMYQPVVTANVISMITESNFIERVPLWVNICIGVAFILISVFVFYSISQKFPSIYDLSTKTLQLVGSVLILYVTVVVFQNYDTKIDFSIALAALLLSADFLEIYIGLINNFFGSDDDEYTVLGPENTPDITTPTAV